MNKISFKLGLLFFATILLVESMLFFYLYIGLIDTRIQEEFSHLKVRGSNHRDVLEKQFNQETMTHVTLMESEADTDVVITDQNRKILIYSDALTTEMNKSIEKEMGFIPTEGVVVENQWKTKTYISTVTPIMIGDQLKGYVYMFKNTSTIIEMIARLKHHFLVGGIFSFFITIITVFFLSRVIANPLIRMKRVTEKLSQGDFSGSLHIKSDDELGDLARSIQRLSSDLQHLKKERNEFLANISHELRTPLTYIKGYSDIALRPELGNMERQKYLAIIHEEAAQLSALLEDLFKLAKMDQHQFSIQREIVKLKPYLTNVIEKLRPAFDEKRITLEIKCLNHIQVNIDPSRFEQVIKNLLDNALKYSNPHSKVELMIQEKETIVEIMVKDEGVGIPESDLPYIFDRLYRVDKSRSRESGGTGLGLSIAKEIVEAHGGTIEVESKIGQGTKILVYIEKVKADAKNITS